MQTTLLSLKPANWLPMLMLGFLLSSATLNLTSCAGAPFSATTLDNIKMMGQKLIPLMEKASNTPFANIATEADALTKSLEQAQQVAGSLKRNKEGAEMWRLLNADMVTPFLNRWKGAGQLNPALVAPAVTQVRNALAALERAELGKRGAPAAPR